MCQSSDITVGHAAAPSISHFRGGNYALAFSVCLFQCILEAVEKSKLPSAVLSADGIFVERTLAPPDLIRFPIAAAIRLCRNYKEVYHERQVSQVLKDVERGRIWPISQVDSLIRQGREVARRHSLLTVAVAFALAALAGLGTVVAGSAVTVLAGQPVRGIYELSFLGPNPTPPPDFIPLTNNSLHVGQELVLEAHVEDISRNPAQRGEVIFQDCEVKNSPAPSAACNSGSGVWTHVFQMSVDASGNASVDYGFISIPDTIGFRFRYLGQGSGIANGASAPGDVTWF